MFTLLLAAVVETTPLPATLPPSTVRVETVARPPANSVQFYDNLRNVTNRVLDRSIYQDVRRVHTDRAGKLHALREKQNRAAVEEHCKTRLRAETLPEAECGRGFNRD
jgi:hypothetical protein